MKPSRSHRSRGKGSSTSSFWPTYQTTWPPSTAFSTESLHLWCDPHQTPLLSITHRCLQVTPDFSQCSYDSLDILWDGNWMGSSHDSEWPEHESSWTEHIFVPNDTWEVIALGFLKHRFHFDGQPLKFYCDDFMTYIVISCVKLSHCCWLRNKKNEDNMFKRTQGDDSTDIMWWFSPCGNSHIKDCWANWWLYLAPRNDAHIVYH